MPRNGSGTYSLPAGNPVVSGTTIQASWANSTLADISTELTGSLARNGAGGMLGALRGVDGTVSVPAFSFTSETTAGFYRAGTGDVRFAMAGADVYTVTSTGVGIGTSSIGPGTRLEIRSANTITDSRGILAVNSTNAAAANLGGSISFGGETGQATTPYVFGAISGRYEGSGYAGYLQLSTTTSGGVVTERARIDSSGNLGLGVTPSAWGSTPKALQAGAVSSFVGAGLTFGTNVGYNYFTDNLSDKYIQNGFASAYNQRSGEHRWLTAPSGTAGNAISFTQAMTLTDGGNLLVGTTTDLGGLGGRVQIDSGTARGIVQNMTSTSPTGRYQEYLYIGTTVGFISTNGTTTTYSTTSDYRLKENVQPMKGALAKVAALKPVTYQWKSDGSDGEGFIAHELAEVVPQCVSGEKDSVNENGMPQYQGIDTSFLVATLTAAIQEQQAIIEDLRARVAALEAA